MINSSFKVELQSYLNQEEIQKVETLAENAAALYSDTEVAPAAAFTKGFRVTYATNW
ncbi:hypothetical protein JCM19240_2903 [Vibrio maritimus]|uniref:Uncharacterized protein n=1 Tax=Vibrio maritimus TaxID=990268 RepID=A0A090TDH2_9VIBR|nr:hypothetical protein JCM19240_2903 [Vibrio maritimus]